MSDSFYLTERGHAFCLVGGKASSLSPKLSGFTLTKKANPGKCDKSVILVQNVSVRKEGIVVPVVGVDKKRLLYSFGENFGSVSITAIVLTGGKEYDDKEPKQLLEKWEQKGVVGSKTPINLKWAGIETKVFVTGIDIAAQDPQTNTIKVELSAVIAPVSNKNG